MQTRTKRLIVGVITFLAVVAFMARDSVELRRRWQVSESVSATVVDYYYVEPRRRTSARAGSQGFTRETLEFWYNGAVYQATLDSHAQHLQRIGETVYVLVEFTDPIRVYHNIEPTLSTMVTRTVGLSIPFGVLLGFTMPFMLIRE